MLATDFTCLWKYGIFPCYNTKKEFYGIYNNSRVQVSNIARIKKLLAPNQLPQCKYFQIEKNCPSKQFKIWQTLNETM